MVKYEDQIFNKFTELFPSSMIEKNQKHIEKNSYLKTSDSGMLAHSMIVLGYRDYIASRLLLNNNLIIQGLTLASSSIEKYIKVILVAHNKTKNEINIHLNKIDKLKAILDSCYYDVTKKMDVHFLDILGKVYTIRYYDDIKEPITIGFYINQFIAELDFVVDFFENTVFKDFKDEKGEILKTPYKRALENKDKILIHNNYILQGITKKEFMEKEDTGFAIHIKPNSLALGEVNLLGKRVKNEYNGSIGKIEIKFESIL